MTNTIGRGELQYIVDIFQRNYPDDYYLQRSSEALMNGADYRDFTNSINYLFIRAWQFRQYALQQCRQHVPVTDDVYSIHYNPCYFPIDLLNEKMWFNEYFADQEGALTYWPAEQTWRSTRRRMITPPHNNNNNNNPPQVIVRGRRRYRSRRRDAQEQRARRAQRAAEQAQDRIRRGEQRRQRPGSIERNSTRGGGRTRRKKKKKKRTKLRKKKNRKTKRRRRKRKRTRRRR